MAAGTPFLGIGSGAITKPNTGHDGVSWTGRFALPDGVGDGAHNYSLVQTGGDGVVFGPDPDFDIEFYDADNNFLDGGFNFGDEAGAVPAGTAKASIYLFDGVDAAFHLEITHCVPDPANFDC